MPNLHTNTPLEVTFRGVLCPLSFLWFAAADSTLPLYSHIPYPPLFSPPFLCRPPMPILPSSSLFSLSLISSFSFHLFFAFRFLSYSLFSNSSFCSVFFHFFFALLYHFLSFSLFSRSLFFSFPSISSFFYSSSPISSFLPISASFCWSLKWLRYKKNASQHIGKRIT